MIFIPNELFFIVYQFVGPKSLYLNKDYYHYLQYKKKPYLENTEGNHRHDALNIVKAAFAIDKKVINSELNSKGNISMKLESLSRLNGIDTSFSHSAMVDVENTVKVLELIKNKQPDLWSDYFKTSSKQSVEDIIRKESIITLNEYFYGRSRLYLCAPLHPNSFMHPVFKWSQVVDLRTDPEPLFKLSYKDLKTEMKKTPKFLRTVRSNKAPIILDASYGMKVEPYNIIDPTLIKKRAEMIKSNEKFANDICNILRENAEEKIETSSIGEIMVENIMSLFTQDLLRIKIRLYFLSGMQQIGKKSF